MGRLRVSGRRAAVTAAAALLLGAGAPGATAATSPTALDAGAVVRLQGEDRWGTAVAASQRLVPVPDPDQVVLVASGEGYADALAAAPATRGWGAPVPLLLVPRDGALPAVVTAELDRLAPRAVHVVGGPAAVSDGVADQLRRWDPQLVRVSGDDRYATAEAVALTSAGGAGDDEGPAGGGTVYLSSGTAYPDALAGAAVAARAGSPLLLTDPRQLPGPTAEALTELAPATVVVTGLSGAVSDGVLDAVRQLLPGAQVVRRGGDDRAATAAALSAAAYPGGADGVVLATASNFPDALAAGPLAAQLGWPLLLTGPGCTSPAAADEAARLGARRVVVMGGPGVVSDAAAQLQRCP